MKFDYLNTMYGTNDVRLGHVGICGAEAKSPQEALKKAIEAAKRSRKIWGFPMTIEVKLTFRERL